MAHDAITDAVTGNVIGVDITDAMLEIALRDCLSAALQVGAYMPRIAEAGFLDLHQIKHTPWQVIDGIHFCP